MVLEDGFERFVAFDFVSNGISVFLWLMEILVFYWIALAFRLSVFKRGLVFNWITFISPWSFVVVDFRCQFQWCARGNFSRRTRLHVSHSKGIFSPKIDVSLPPRHRSSVSLPFLETWPNNSTTMHGEWIHAPKYTWTGNEAHLTRHSRRLRRRKTTQKDKTQSVTRNSEQFKIFDFRD